MDSKPIGMERYTKVPAGEKFWDLLNLIFTDEFMKKYTNFEAFEYFKYSSAVMTTWNGEYMIFQEDVFNNFVKESTQFSSWDKMVMKAADEKFEK